MSGNRSGSAMRARRWTRSWSWTFERRQLLQQVESMRAEQNLASTEISRVKDKSTRMPARSPRLRQLSQRIKEMEPAIKEIDEQLNDLLLMMPNIPDESVPVGKDESENVVIRSWGEPRQFDFEPLPHWEIGERLGIMDFERSAKISRRQVRGAEGAGRKAGAIPDLLHARRAHDGARLHRALPAVPGAARVHGGHRPAPQVRGGHVPDRRR